MAKGGDIVRMGKALTVTIDQIRAELPAGIEVHQFQNQSKVVTTSVNEFVGTLIAAVVIVLGVSFVSLGLHFKPRSFRFTLDWRPGLVVGITIPLVLAITFVTMYYWGVGLHKISLGSLIIALGLLVDDAIISVEMMVRKLEEGYDKVRAATFAYDATAMPMLTGTLITAVGFLPIGLAQSTVGEYTFAIFAVTAAALLISWFVSVYFVPYLGVWLLKTRPHAAGEQPHELFDTPFYARFRAIVNWCVRHRWITIAATIGTMVLGIVGMGHVQNQFFPESSRPEIVVDLWYPEGTSYAANEAVTKRVEARVMKLDGVGNVTTWVGSGVERFVLVLDQVFPQSNVSQMVVMPNSPAARERLRKLLPELLATEFPEVRGRAKLLPTGAPVPYPVQFRVVEPDPARVRAYADEVNAIMRKNPNLRGINDNWNESVKALRLDVDQDKARALGVTSQSIAQAARTINTGTTIGQYREDDKLVDIVLRQPLQERNQVTDLANAYVPTSTGRSIPLGQIARANFTWEPGVLWREGRDRDRAARPAVRPGACAHARRLPHRDRRRSRGEQQGPGLDRGRRAADAVRHVHAADAAIAQLQPLGAGVPDRASGHRRDRRGAAGAEPAVRFRRAARRDRADGHDHAQLGDPDRPDRAGSRARRRHLGRDRRGGGATLPPDHADGGRGGAGDDPVVAQRVLGADGGGHHGRPDRRDGADAAVAAGDVRGLVPRQTARRREGCRDQLKSAIRRESQGGGAARRPRHPVGRKAVRAGGEIGRRTRFRS